ncbi:hypothetical protein ACTOB_003677 [Actinoplanes oblitus]|uniref:Uncharacterized protein n=1 Tax=Actinoplanes oblitus TaxID=3040509 RepID=A0ABY8WTN9_9ACTN|nr:hypothetical protein [Actinoplanes oblitus]WIN00004.1 hypothetical protein ACTOB_003677 [Actinoplanes oblitus]
MSRHELEPSADNVSCVFVGWEAPLGTFFAQVYLTTNDSECDAPDFERGGDLMEITDPEQVIKFAAQYARIPADLAATLNADAAREGMHEMPLAVQLMNGIEPEREAINWDEVPIPF